MSILTRAALLGLATGGRSSLGLSALAVTSTRTRGGSAVTRPWVAKAAALASAAEFVGDKVPGVPSRSQPVGAAPRLVLGALSGAVLAHREGNSRGVTALSAAIGVAAAVGGIKAGVSWRGFANDRFGSDVPGALLEDATWLATARSAVN